MDRLELFLRMMEEVKKHADGLLIENIRITHRGNNDFRLMDYQNSQFVFDFNVEAQAEQVLNGNEFDQLRTILNEYEKIVLMAELETLLDARTKPTKRTKM